MTELSAMVVASCKIFFESEFVESSIQNVTSFEKLSIINLSNICAIWLISWSALGMNFTRVNCRSFIKLIVEQ